LLSSFAELKKHLDVGGILRCLTITNKGKDKSLHNLLTYLQRVAQISKPVKTAKRIKDESLHGLLTYLQCVAQISKPVKTAKRIIAYICNSNS
jgi:hypothetical protein